MSSLNQIKTAKAAYRHQIARFSGVFSIQRGGSPLRISKSLLLLPLALLTLFNCDAIFDIEPPEIEIIEPKEGITYYNIVPCSLIVTDNSMIEMVEIFLDDDLAHTFKDEPYANDLSIPRYGRIPTQIKVVAYDHVGNWTEAQRKIGAIEGFELISPNGGEFWPELSRQTISWADYGDDDSSVILYYSLDEGATWLEIDDIIPNDGSYDWDLPDITDTNFNCRIRVSGTISGRFDISDNSFTVGSHALIGSYDGLVSVNGVFVTGEYAYVAEGSKGLLIIDVSNPTNPSLAGRCNTNSAMDVFVTGGYAYVADYEGGFKIINVSNPTNPVIVGSYNTQNFAVDVYVSDGYAYVAINRGGFQIINVTNPAQPTLVGSYEAPDGTAQGVFVASGYAYVADYDGGFKIVDVSNPATPFLTGTLALGKGRDVYVSRSNAYVASDEGGLMVVNVSDPTNPTLTSIYETSGDAWGVFASNSYAYIADYWGNDLVIIDVSEPTNPILAGTCDTPGAAVDVYVSDGYAYIAAYLDGLHIVDISGLP